jgi:2,3-bisphosphoglycerate-independent phosphoglycerate mutase
MRGFSQKPDLPSLEEIYGIKSAAIAAYPMYRGIAKLLGMNILETEMKIENEFTTLEDNWNDFDFFYLHIKGCDSAGEDGDFNRKVKIIEEVDSQLPRMINLNPDCIIIAGDHSTPSLLKYHSWHPVPVLLKSNFCRPDSVKQFGERPCMTGGLGPRFPAVDLMPLALANVKRLEKFGA